MLQCGNTRILPHYRSKKTKTKNNAAFCARGDCSPMASLNMRAQHLDVIRAPPLATTRAFGCINLQQRQVKRDDEPDAHVAAKRTWACIVFITNPLVRATYGSNRSHNARARSATASIVARMNSAGLLLVRAPATRNDASPVIQALLSHAPRTTDFAKHINHICALNRHRHRCHRTTHDARSYAPRYPGLRSPDANGSTTSPCAAGDMALTCAHGHQCDATINNAGGAVLAGMRTSDSQVSASN